MLLDMKIIPPIIKDLQFKCTFNLEERNKQWRHFPVLPKLRMYQINTETKFIIFLIKNFQERKYFFGKIKKVFKYFGLFQYE